MDSCGCTAGTVLQAEVANVGSIMLTADEGGSTQDLFFHVMTRPEQEFCRKHPAYTTTKCPVGYMPGGPGTTWCNKSNSFNDLCFWLIRVSMKHTQYFIFNNTNTVLQSFDTIG